MSNWDLLVDRRSSCIQRARAAYGLLAENVHRAEITQRTGLSRTRLAHLLKVLQLPAVVIEFLDQGKLSQGHGELLTAMPSSRAIELARSALAHGWSVRELERRAKGKGVAADDGNTAWLKRTLEDHFCCPVDIVFDGVAGRLTIAFASLDELDGVFAKCGVQLDQ